MHWLLHVSTRLWYEKILKSIRSFLHCTVCRFNLMVSFYIHLENYDAIKEEMTNYNLLLTERNWKMLVRSSTSIEYNCGSSKFKKKYTWKALYKVLLLKMITKKYKFYTKYKKRVKVLEKVMFDVTLQNITKI